MGSTARNPDLGEARTRSGGTVQSVRYCPRSVAIHLGINKSNPCASTALVSGQNDYGMVLAIISIPEKIRFAISAVSSTLSL